MLTELLELAEASAELGRPALGIESQVEDMRPWTETCREWAGRFGSSGENVDDPGLREVARAYRTAHGSAFQLWREGVRLLDPPAVVTPETVASAVRGSHEDMQSRARALLLALNELMELYTSQLGGEVELDLNPLRRAASS